MWSDIATVSVLPAHLKATSGNLLSYFALLVSLLLSDRGLADDLATTVPLFASTESLSISIEAPLKTILRDRGEQRAEHAALLKYSDPTGTTHVFNVQLRVRGNFRRQADVCKFPPLRVNFKKSETEGTIFASQDKLKLVTHCQSRKKVYEQYLLKEYLAYRVFNLLTEQSFNARLLGINYINTESRGKATLHSGFFIEDREAMAHRNGATVAEASKINTAQLEPVQSNLTELFAYLIGNTDWSIVRGPEGDRCCHNAVSISRQNNEFIPVPYDFDITGLVSPPYATPNPRFKIRNVRQRLYRGRCRPDALVARTLDTFRSQKADILQLFENQPGLTKTTRRTARTYIEKFYAIIDDPKQLDRKISKRCRG